MSIVEIRSTLNEARGFRQGAIGSALRDIIGGAHFRLGGGFGLLLCIVLRARGEDDASRCDYRNTDLQYRFTSGF